MKYKCKHEHRCRYTHGFKCEDCGRFIAKGTVEYLYFEGMDSLWMVFHNLDCQHHRDGKPTPSDILAHKEKLWDLTVNNKIGSCTDKQLLDYFEECKLILLTYNKTENSASFELKA